MLRIQVVPRAGMDAYKLLERKVTHEAQTWEWVNRAKTRLQRKEEGGAKRGYIEVESAQGIIVAEIHPRDKEDLYFLAEKFVGRLIAWFADDLVAINIQLSNEKRIRK